MAWWRHYKECHPYGPRWVTNLPRPRISRRQLEALLGPQPGEHLLEIGPGYGHYTVSVGRGVAPGTLSVVDLRRPLLDQTMERAVLEGVENLRPVQGDAQRLPYSDSRFDGAYLVACLGEVPDPAKVILELARVLRPGGRLVVGETAADPHRVRLPILIKQCHRASLQVRAAVGRVSYFARFDKPHLSGRLHDVRLP